MMRSIFYDGKVSIQALKAADDETLNGATLDMKGFDKVTFIAGALKGEALDFSIKAQQGAASNLSDAADLEGTSVTFSPTVGADALTVLELVNPQERYVRAVITVPDAAAATPTFCVAIQHKASTRPQSNDGEQHIAPDEGTA